MVEQRARRRVVRRRASVGALLLVASTVVTGCQSTAAPDEASTALLDDSTGEIIRPIDAYRFFSTQADWDRFDRANSLRIGRCMAERGLPYSAATIVPSASRSTGDRDFGLWWVPQARTYGFAIPPSELAAAREADAVALGPEWELAASECSNASDAAFAPVTVPNEMLVDTLAERLAREAAAAARTDAAWRDAVEDWRRCLGAAGLTAPTEAEDWLSAEATALLSQTPPQSSREEAIRVATLEATCNVETGLAQRLADLESRYAAPLIGANEAGLEALREQVLAQRAAMDRYIEDHG